MCLRNICGGLKFTLFGPPKNRFDTQLIACQQQNLILKNVENNKHSVTCVRCMLNVVSLSPFPIYTKY